jgi:sugar phosphate isomerase/epimerase
MFPEASVALFGWPWEPARQPKNSTTAAYTGRITMKISRTFLIFLLAGLCFMVWIPIDGSSKSYQLQFGIQTWTLRNLNFDQVVDFAVKHKVKYLQLIGTHLNPLAPVEEIKQKKAILDKNGLVCYTFGVNVTSTEKEQNRKSFEFAKMMGIKLMIVEPRNMSEWDNLEELVKEYDIKLAIHNHGLETTYGNPETVKKVLQARDKRIGVCIDVGWVTAAGFDCAKVFRDYGDRVYDIHLKDKKVDMVEGKKVVTDVTIGTGSTNLIGLFKELKAKKWDGILALETDQNLKDPTEYVLSAMKFVQKH